MNPPDQPTRPTEAHYQLAHIIRQSSTQERAAQLIADSEARAVETAIARWSGGFDMSLPDLYEAAKSERDKATAELATERARLDWFYEADIASQDIRAAIDAAMKEGAK